MDVAYSSAIETKTRRRWGLPDHLPDLRGKWLTLYTIVWAIMLALAIVGPIWGQYQLSGYYQKPAWLPYGFAVSSSSGIQIVAVSSGEAQQAESAPATGSWPSTGGSFHSLRQIRWPVLMPLSLMDRAPPLPWLRRARRRATCT